MAPPLVASGVRELVLEEEHSGITIEQMIEILYSGVTVEELLRIIQWKLSGAKVPPGASRWLM